MARRQRGAASLHSCAAATFHASRGSARAYLAGRPGIDGEILGQQAAIDLGRHIFGPLLGRTA